MFTQRRGRRDRRMYGGRKGRRGQEGSGGMRRQKGRRRTTRGVILMMMMRRRLGLVWRVKKGMITLMIMNTTWSILITLTRILWPWRVAISSVWL